MSDEVGSVSKSLNLQQTTNVWVGLGKYFGTDIEDTFKDDKECKELHLNFEFECNIIDIVRIVFGNDVALKCKNNPSWKKVCDINIIFYNSMTVKPHHRKQFYICNVRENGVNLEKSIDDNKERLLEYFMNYLKKQIVLSNKTINDIEDVINTAIIQNIMENNRFDGVAFNDFIDNLPSTINVNYSVLIKTECSNSKLTLMECWKKGLEQHILNVPMQNINVYAENGKIIAVLNLTENQANELLIINFFKALDVIDW